MSSIPEEEYSDEEKNYVAFLSDEQKLLGFGDREIRKNVSFRLPIEDVGIVAPKVVVPPAVPIRIDSLAKVEADYDLAVNFQKSIFKSEGNVIGSVNQAHPLTFGHYDSDDLEKCENTKKWYYFSRERPFRFGGVDYHINVKIRTRNADKVALRHCDGFPNCQSEDVFCNVCMVSPFVWNFKVQSGRKPKIVLVIDYDKRRDLYSPYQTDSVAFPILLKKYIVGLASRFHTQMNLFPKVDVSDRIMDAYEDFSEKMDKILDTFNDLKHKVTDHGVISFLFTEKKILLIPCTTLFIYNAVSLWKNGDANSAIGLSASAMFLKFLLPNDLYKRMTKWLPTKEEDKKPEVFKSQMGSFDEYDIKNWFTDVITFLVIGKAAHETFDNSNMKTKTSFIASLPKLAEGVGFAVSSLIPWLEKVVEFIRVHILKLPEKEMATTGIHDFDLWSKEVDKIVDLYNKNEFECNITNFEYFHRVRSMGETLTITLKGKDVAEVRNYVKYKLNALVSIGKLFTNANLFKGGPRMIPLTVLFRGQPGVGKSKLIYPMAVQLLDKIIPDNLREVYDQNWENLVYSRQAENVYWEGYTPNHFMTIFDDFAQMKDVPGSADGEGMNLIRCSNIFRMSLHMASLELKNKSEFESRVIFANTNARKFKFNSLWSEEAVLRRFHKCYDVCPTRGYSKIQSEDIWTRRLDKEKLKSSLDLDACEFHEFDLLTDKYTGNTLTYEGVISDLVVKYKELEKDHQQFAMSLDTMRFKSQVNNVSLSTLRLEKKTLIEPDEEELTTRFLGVARESSEASFLVDLIMQTAATDDTIGRTIHLRNVIMYFPSVFEDLMIQNEAGVYPNLTQSVVEDVIDYIVANLDYVEPLTIKGKLVKISSFCETKLSMIKEKLYEFVEKYGFIKLLAAVVSPIAIGYSLYTLVGKSESPVLKPYKDVYQSESWTDGKKGKRSKRASKKSVNRRDVHDSSSFTHEGGFDITMENIISKVGKRNVYSLEHGEVIMGYITFIKGRVAMMPAHFISTLEEADDSIVMLVKQVESSRTFSLPVNIILACKKVIYKDADICLIKFPEIFPIHSDIVKFFIPNSMFERINKSPVLLDIRERGVKRRFMSIGTLCHDVGHSPDGEDENFMLSNAIKYNAVTKNGDCGSILYLNDPTSGNNKIIGIHVAANEFQVALANCIDKEFLESIIKNFGDVEYSDESTFEKQSNSEIFGFVPLTTMEVSSTISSRSRISPSPLYGKWCTPKTKPAHLVPFTDKDDNFIEPFRLAVQKYNINYTYIPERELDVCVADVFRQLESSMNDFEVKSRRVMTMEEAIIGIPGLEFFDAIPRSTSAGYPMCETVCKGTKGKQVYFGTEDEYTLGGEAYEGLILQVNKIIDQAKSGIVSDVIYKDFLKDERRPIEKVESGKTRLVSGAPVDYVIAVRIYFLSFCANFMRSRIFNGSAVGIDVYSDEWDTLYKYLLKCGRHTVAGDYKNFDGSCNSQIVYKIVEYINRWYDDGPENAQIRRSLIANLCYSKHIFGKETYGWLGALPSGHPLTTTINTLVNLFLFRFAWIRIFGIEDIESYEFNVRTTCYGDDNVAVIRESRINEYNQLTITKALSEINYVYTNELKDGQMFSTRDIGNVSFLKRMWRYEKTLNRYVAPLDMDVVLEIPFWVRSKLGAMQQCMENVNVSIKELSLHEDGIYDHWTRKIKKGAEDAGLHSPFVPPRFTKLMEIRTEGSILDSH